MAALHRDDAQRLRHAVVDDPDDARRGLGHIQAQRLCDMLADRGLRRRRVDGKPPAQQVRAAEIAQHHIGVRHRGPRPALPVAGRPRLRARALRPDPERPAGVEPGDAAAARAHFREVDHRHPDGVAGAVEPAPDIALAADLVFGCGLDAPVLDQARFRRRAAHVEGDEVRAAELAAHALRGDDPGGGPRLDGARRHLERLGHIEHAAVRAHDVERGQAEFGERGLQPVQVGGQHRPDIGADGRGAGALELADFRQHLAGEEHRQARKRRPEPFADAALVRVVQEGEHEADRNRVHVQAPDALDDRVQPGLVERGHDLALGVDPLGHLEAPAARHQHRRGVLEQVVKVRAGRAPKLQHVAEARGRDQRDVGALALQQRVGDDRGGVGDERDRGGVDAVVAHGRAYAVDHRGAEVARRGRDLGDAGAPALLVQHGDIGEGPADIHPDPPPHSAAPPGSRPCLRSIAYTRMPGCEPRRCLLPRCEAARERPLK